MKQILLDQSFRMEDAFGGEMLQGRRKSRRPFSSKQAMHLTLRSSQAKGKYNFHLKNNKRIIQWAIQTFATQYGIRLYRNSINTNHLHFVLRARSKRSYVQFVRALAGAIALKITGSKKGVKLAERFWDFRPFSRILAWGKAFEIAVRCVLMNELETSGQISYSLRGVDRPRAKPPSSGRD